MKVLAVIPARGGSKGVPRKNLRMVGGRPLIAWSIEAALEARLVDAVVVSSDDPEILEVARYCGAKTLERPAELATDEAATDPVLVHVVRDFRTWWWWYQRPELAVLLQPTVPVRRAGLVDDCIRHLVETHADSLLTGYPLHFCWWREDEYSTGAGPDPVRWRSQCPRRPRRQDMTSRELMWHEDGSVYVTRTELLMGTGARLGGRMEVFETEKTVDIDDDRDLAVAEALLAYQAVPGTEASA